MNVKKYPISTEAQIKNKEIYQLQVLRDVYAAAPFMHKRAVKTAKELAKVTHDFWRMVRSEIPELKKCAIIYDVQTGVVYEDSTPPK